MENKSTIKMRVNKDKESNCFSCGVNWKNTAEMYDLAIGYKKTRILPLCRNCVNELFVKSLKAERMYDSKIKSQQDLRRAENEALTKHGKVGSNPSKALNSVKIKKEED